MFRKHTAEKRDCPYFLTVCFAEERGPGAIFSGLSLRARVRRRSGLTGPRSERFEPAAGDGVNAEIGARERAGHGGDRGGVAGQVDRERDSLLEAGRAPCKTVRGRDHRAERGLRVAEPLDHALPVRVARRQRRRGLVARAKLARSGLAADREQEAFGRDLAARGRRRHRHRRGLQHRALAGQRVGMREAGGFFRHEAQPLEIVVVEHAERRHARGRCITERASPCTRACSFVPGLALAEPIDHRLRARAVAAGTRGLGREPGRHVGRIELRMGRERLGSCGHRLCRGTIATWLLGTNGVYGSEAMVQRSRLDAVDREPHAFARHGSDESAFDVCDRQGHERISARGRWLPFT